MNWRYATKAFNREMKISDADRAALLETLRLAPSSYGLQPWKFVIVSDKDVRRKLGDIVPANRAKFEDSSLLVVLARRRLTTADNVTRHIKTLQEARNVSAEELQPFKDMLIQNAAGKTAEAQDIWNSRQVYVALGCAVAAAALLKIGAGEPENIVEFLRIDAFHRTSIDCE
ncbi:MAG: nitroreductase family protein [Pseudomonadota bacterium]